MSFQKVIYTFLVLFLVAAGGVFAYLYSQLLNPAQQGTTSQQGTDDVTIPKAHVEKEKQSASFFIENASPEYARLHQRVTAIVTNRTNDEAMPSRATVVGIYTDLLTFYANEQHAPKERAFALNLLMLVYSIGFDGSTLKDGIAHTPEFVAKYNEHVAYAKKFKQKRVRTPGTMFDTVGDPVVSYASQMTMSDINARSFELYPNSHAGLREFNNKLQAATFFYNNFETGKKLEGADQIVADAYGKDYLSRTETKLLPYLSDAKIYDGTYSSSYEIHIMYASSVLWVKYLTLNENPSLNAQAAEVLHQVVDQANLMEKRSDEYNTGRLFYGYALSALTKMRVASTGKLSKEENDALKKQAIVTFKRLIDTQAGNKRMVYWLAHLPKNGWMSNQMHNLAGLDSGIGTFVEYLERP
jgi:hypothetical protein